nr:MAG TPA: Scaffold protein [Microviridae sp.]
MVKIITVYDYEARPKPVVAFDSSKDPLARSLTNQSDKEGSDINVIMARYEKTGLVPGTMRTPNYGDFSGILDFHALSNTLAKASQAFDVLPAIVRLRFGNDPAQLVDFLHDSVNDVEAVKLGLKDASVLPRTEIVPPVVRDASVLPRPEIVPPVVRVVPPVVPVA